MRAPKKSRTAVWGLAGLLLSGQSAMAAPSFGPASPVSEFNTASNDQLTDLSPDGLTAILQSDRAGIFRVYSSTRATVFSAWGAPSNTSFTALNSGTNTGHAILSPNGLELFYQEHPIIKTATRANTSLPFSAGSAVGALNVASNYERPGKMSADGLRIYYEVAGFGDIDLYMASRATTSSPWGAPTAGPFTANINTTSIESEPFITPDELQLFYVSNRPGTLGSSDIWWANRASTADPFSAPVNLSSINGAAIDSSPELFGNTLFFTSTRGGSYDVFTAQLVPEPASLLLLAAAGALLTCRRRMA